jgi:hypothetical protein
MGKQSRLSHDQKRKLKLKKRAERTGPDESLAYHGKKYQAAQYTPVVFRTELGINEASVLTVRTLTDRDVEIALTNLIGALREGPLAPMDDATTPRFDLDDRAAIVEWCIRRNWAIYAETAELPGRSDLAGVLRTILASLETRRSMTLNARGYLNYLEGFMKQLGARVDVFDSKGRLIETSAMRAPALGGPDEAAS